MPLPLLRFLVILGVTGASAQAAAPEAPRHRVIVSTDAGGTDFDDFQSVVHLLLYTDVLDLEGLISSPYGGGRKEHILRVIGHYEKDYPRLRAHSARYPTPEALRAITKQGETEVAPHRGVRRSTEGSEWIVSCARRDDPRPLHVLIWGGIEDLAQALHDAPDILPKLRVYFIGGPNKKWSPDAYHYLATQHPTLWMIECNESYQGWFNGGNMAGDLGNERFVATHVAGRGALGEYFAKGISFQGTTRTAIRMGDSPSVTWLLQGNPADPTQPGWGGQFVRAWKRPYAVFERLTTPADRIEQFSIFELVLRPQGTLPYVPSARLVIENQSLVGHLDAAGAMRFRFSPKEAKEYRYTIQSNIPSLNGSTGGLTAVQPAADAAARPDPNLPNWWTDDPSPALREGNLIGAKTVNRWREEFLRDFAARLERCLPPKGGPAPAHFISVAITRSPAEVYEFASNPVNLPKWAAGLGSSIRRIGDDWVADSPMGRVKVKFVDKNAVGVLDHVVTLPSGDKVYNPLRVQPNGTGSEVVFTLYRLPGTTTDAFQQDAGQVRQDLERLKALLEK
jgi:hypothetical protein